MAKSIIVPSNPADLKKLKGFIKEGSDCLTRIEAEKDALKDIADVAHEEFELPKSIINALIRHHHKADFEKKEMEFNDFTELWDAIKGV